MKICLAQIRPHKGDIMLNLENHHKLVDMALPHEIDVMVFPELSVTGYEPELAESLKIEQDDDRFDFLQTLCDRFGLTLGIGAPVPVQHGCGIGMVVFQPRHVRNTYVKKYLHESETPYFLSHESFTGLVGPQKNIGLGICYEMTIDDHSDTLATKGAKYYINSSVKSQASLERSYQCMSQIAKKHRMKTFLSNSVGETGPYDSVGGSAVWDEDGSLLLSMDHHREGILIYDTKTGQSVIHLLNP